MFGFKGRIPLLSPWRGIMTVPITKLLMHCSTVRSWQRKQCQIWKLLYHHVLSTHSSNSFFHTNIHFEFQLPNCYTNYFSLSSERNGKVWLKIFVDNEYLCLPYLTSATRVDLNQHKSVSLYLTLRKSGLVLSLFPITC